MTSQIESRVASLEADLNNFDPVVRSSALNELAGMAQRGDIVLEPEHDAANMHCHTFFSFNAYGYSPSGLVWLAKRRGFKVIGTVDFDVLDAVDEFLGACELLGVRGSCGLETRVFLPEFATREMNSPGEPAVLYHMGIGFTSSKIPDAARVVAADLRERASKRNQDVVARVNAYLDPVKLDYVRDVLPLAPGGNPTERHIVLAYVRAAERQMSSLAEFWAGKLNMPVDQTAKLLADSAKFQNTVRTKLMKAGGVGYVQPDSGSFPSIDDVHKMILACDALPCAAWLDGMSAGEQAMEELLNLLIGKGAVALNIVPDRNWNIADPDTKRVRMQKLYEVVALAQKLDLPLNIGTEMNSFGQKLIDDFDVPEVAPVRQAFLDGAHFIYGHTALQRDCGMGYQSEWAKAKLPSRQVRNAFYTQVGYRVPPKRSRLALNAQMSPGEVLAKLVERSEG